MGTDNQMAVALLIFAGLTVFLYRWGQRVDREEGPRKGLIIDILALTSAATLAIMIASGRPGRQVVKSAPTPELVESQSEGWRYLLAFGLIAVLVVIGKYYAQKGVALNKLLGFGAVAIGAGVAFPQTIEVVTAIISGTMAIANFFWGWYTEVVDLWY